jgi:peptidyl-prolyl cis-trans isomerase B (cyclophilin B)
MAVCTTGNGRAVLRWGVVLVTAVLAGCHRQEGDAAKTENTAMSAANPPTVAEAAKADLRLRQPFAEATVADMPDQYLPDVTLTGKSVGKLYEEVVRRWDKIALSTAKGEPLHYTATIDTELGSIEIELFPERAPNHVRNFIALAQIGYYDGLLFERTINEQVEDDPSAPRVELIEGGCPTGTGNPGYGSIGYWLKPEFSKDLSHVEGTVGACRGEEPDSAACRFYITLSKIPVMDGERTIFGKVTRGLDVVRRISTQPVINSPEYPLGDRPEKPTVLRKVTIQASPGNGSATVQQARR